MLERVVWGIMAQDKTCWKKRATKHLEKGRKGGDHNIHVHVQLGKTKLVWSCSMQDFTGNSSGKHYCIFPNPCAFPWASARALAKERRWIRGSFNLTQDRVSPTEYKNQDSFWYKTKQTLIYHIHLILSLLKKSRLNFKPCLFLCKWNHVWNRDLWCYLQLPSASLTNSS